MQRENSAILEPATGDDLATVDTVYIYYLHFLILYFQFVKLYRITMIPINLIMVGDVASGKTSLARRYVFGTFQEDGMAT